MKYRLIPILITLIIIVIGHILKRSILFDYHRRLNFTIGFQRDFINMANYFAKTGEFDPDLYGKVTNDLDAIQLELGAGGIISEMIDPLKGIKVRNYQIFMNIIHEMRAASGAMDMALLAGRIDQMIGICDDALRRHVGNLSKAIDVQKKCLWNPFACFGEGIRWLVGLPWQLLVWLGIIEPDRRKAVQENMLFKFVGRIITLVGLLGSIITILLGWEDTLALLNRLLQR